VIPTGLATVGQIVTCVLRKSGLDVTQLFSRHGIDPAVFSKPDARIPISVWDAATRDAAERISDPSFGLLAAQCWHPSSLGALGYAWLTSSTLRTGLGRLVRYWRLLGEGSSGYLEETTDGLRLVIERHGSPPLDDGAVNAVVVDFITSMVMGMCRMNAGELLQPLVVHLHREQPEDPEPYLKFFGCEVKFGANGDFMTFSREDVDAALPTSNRQLAATMDRILVDRLAQLDKSNVVARCQSQLLEQLSSGAVTEESMASQLHMSRRTLQRKLADADLTYKQLVDDTRRDLAMRHLDDSSYSITDVTFLLGFSQQSAFTRAFKRWTGMSPSEYRTRTVST